MNYRGAKKAKTIETWIHNAIGVSMIMVVAINMHQVREYRELSERNGRLTTELIRANQKRSELQAVSLKGRGQWMRGQSRWNVEASEILGIEPAPPPPSQDADAFQYNPDQPPE